MAMSMGATVKGSTRDGVRDILNDYPDARNDDRVLCMQFWKNIDKALTVDDIQYATSPEAIRRARQWLNERGFFLATDEDILRKRKQFGTALRVEIANTP